MCGSASGLTGLHQERWDPAGPRTLFQWAGTAAMDLHVQCRMNFGGINQRERDRYLQTPRSTALARQPHYCLIRDFDRLAIDYRGGIAGFCHARRSSRVLPEMGSASTELRRRSRVSLHAIDVGHGLAERWLGSAHQFHPSFLPHPTSSRLTRAET
jgi:hypothetical protein